MTSTPGPWRVSGSHIIQPEEHRHTYSDGSKTSIALVWHHDNPQGPANARLIASAPDLLAACEAMLAAADDDNPFAAGMIFAAVELMHEAVAKAKGESGD